MRIFDALEILRIRFDELTPENLYHHYQKHSTRFKGLKTKYKSNIRSHHHMIKLKEAFSYINHVVLKKQNSIIFRALDPSLPVINKKKIENSKKKKSNESPNIISSKHTLDSSFTTYILEMNNKGKEVALSSGNCFFNYNFHFLLSKLSFILFRFVS